MRSPAGGAMLDMAALPEARDCLVNVDAFGVPVPSARFMGGREVEILSGLDTRRIDIKPDQAALLAAVPGVLANGARALPTFTAGVGPYPDGHGRWIGLPDDAIARRAAVCLYLALVADASLELIGAGQRILIEGRFAEAEVFVRALARLRPLDRIFVCHTQHDVSYGALRLLDPGLAPSCALTSVAPLDVDLSAYAAQWRRDAGRIEAAA